MTSVPSQVVKLSHKQFRAMLKKYRRKKKRQQLAKEREEKELLEQQRRENSPHFKEWEEERQRQAQLLEQYEERERIRKNKLWLLREEQAQIEFRNKQKQLELEKIKREEEKKRIMAEFEQQQLLESKKEEESQKIKSKKEEALQEALSNLPQGDGPWHNPILNQSSESREENQDLRPDREKCQFFEKTGCCRFGDRCSRGHVHPSVSTTILIRGMYTHFSIGHTERDDFDTDAALEYEESERYQDFKDFYLDIRSEFRKYGKVHTIKVCSNHEPHLRGNVYVQYSKQEEAVEAYKNFNGRFYAGRQITCEFTHVSNWRAAVCGLSSRKLCPKGINCNFLHIFNNPVVDSDSDDEDTRNSNFSRSSRRNYSSRRDRNSYRDSQRSGRSSRQNRTPDYRDDYHSSRTPDQRDDYHSRRSRRSSSVDSTDDRDQLESSKNRHSKEHKKKSSHKKKHKDSNSGGNWSSDDSDHGSSHKKKKHKNKKKSKKSDRS